MSMTFNEFPSFMITVSQTMEMKQIRHFWMVHIQICDRF